MFQIKRRVGVIREDKHIKSINPEWNTKSHPKHMMVTLQSTNEKYNHKSKWEDKFPQEDGQWD